MLNSVISAAQRRCAENRNIDMTKLASAFGIFEGHSANPNQKLPLVILISLQ